MELLKGYSNRSDQVERLRALLALPRSRPVDRPVRPAKQSQKRLSRDEVAELVAAYQAGGRAGGVKQLATRFGVHRYTVHNILVREGVTLRPPGLDPADLPEVVRLYQDDDWSLERLAAKFGVAPATVSRALRRVGVGIRPKRGEPGI